MTGTTAPVARQLDLPGQSAVAEGPHDQTGMYVMHHALRRDLAAFVAAVPATPVPDAATWAALARRWQRFADVLHHHHTAEDEAYWPVLQRAVTARGTADDRAEVAAMAQEHAGIDPSLVACRTAMAAMVEHPCEAHRNAVAVRVTALRELLEEHLGHEEGVVLPMIQRVMTAEEFAQAEAGVATYYPRRDAWFLVPWALHGLPPHAAARMLAIAGPAYGVVHRLARAGFARREQAAFRWAG